MPLSSFGSLWPFFFTAAAYFLAAPVCASSRLSGFRRCRLGLCLGLPPFSCLRCVCRCVGRRFAPFLRAFSCWLGCSRVLRRVAVFALCCFFLCVCVCVCVFGRSVSVGLRSLRPPRSVGRSVVCVCVCVCLSLLLAVCRVLS